jgi:hypothetical protein
MQQHPVRGWLPVLLALLLAAIACDSGLVNVTREDRLLDYEKSLRQEADWLWNNMNYCRTHYSPEAEPCAHRTFTHKAVEMDESARAQDPSNASLLDYLDYATLLIQQAHEEWNHFCDGQRNGYNTAAFLESRLTPTYDSLNYVRVVLEPKRPTPKPGSS